jgi:hypothetical protein
MKTQTRVVVVILALIAAITISSLVIIRTAGAGVTCTTYGGKGPGGHRWSQTTCR